MAADETDYITCDHCGEAKPGVERHPDPFVEEVYPEDAEEQEESWWCEDCYSSRHADV